MSKRNEVHASQIDTSDTLMRHATVEFTGEMPERDTEFVATDGTRWVRTPPDCDLAPGRYKWVARRWEPIGSTVTLPGAAPSLEDAIRRIGLVEDNLLALIIALRRGGKLPSEVAELESTTGRDK